MTEERVDNVVKLHVDTRLEIPAGEMLQAIAAGRPENAFVIVWPEDGSLPTYHSSTNDLPIVLLRLNEFIHKFYHGDFGHG